MSGKVVLENVRRYRTIASLYRQTAAFRPDQKWSLLAHAFEYERLARTELERYFTVRDTASRMGDGNRSLGAVKKGGVGSPASPNESQASDNTRAARLRSTSPLRPRQPSASSAIGAERARRGRWRRVGERRGVASPQRRAQRSVD